MKNQYQPLTLKRITQGSLTVTFANRKKRVELVENAIYLAQDVTLQEPSDDYADESFEFTTEALNLALGMMPYLDPEPMGERVRRAFYTTADDSIQAFFEGLKAYDEALMTTIPRMRLFKLNELLYLLAHTTTSQGVAFLLHLLSKADNAEYRFREVIRNSVFSDEPLRAIAQRTGRSMTAFKNEFMRLYGDTPHRWMVRQRIQRARLLVVTTGKSISEIGYECGFNNISHFIKLFKREFQITPLSMRQETVR